MTSWMRKRAGAAALVFGMVSCAVAEAPDDRDLSHAPWPMNGIAWQGVAVDWPGADQLYPQSGVAWKWGAPGAGTLNNIDLVVLEPRALTAKRSACGTYDRVDDYAVVSSELQWNAVLGIEQVVGPRVLVQRGGAWSELGERDGAVVLPATLRNGYAYGEPVAVQLVRVGTGALEDPAKTGVLAHDGQFVWPAYELAVCREADGRWQSLPIVTFGPAVMPPEHPGAPFTYLPGAFAPLALPVGKQLPALQAKVAVFGALPVQLDGEPWLDLESSAGQRVEAWRTLTVAAIALGNGSPVRVPGDPLARVFWNFFTREGQPIYVSARAGDGGDLLYPAAWRGALGPDPIPQLRLSSREADGTLADKLDNVSVGPVTGAAELASGPTHAASGRGELRLAEYRRSTKNPLAKQYVRQLDDHVRRARFGAVAGRASSQSEALDELEGRASFAVVVSALLEGVPGVPPGPISPDKPCDFEYLMCAVEGEPLPPPVFTVHACGDGSCDAVIGEDATVCADDCP